jgi:hypothetical protein
MTRGIVLIAATLAVTSRVAFTQAPQQPLHAPDGGTREMLTSIFVPPLPDAPFSAFVNTEWTKYFADGSTQILRNHRLIARDRQGRIFQERRTFVPDGGRGESQIMRTELAEPATHTIAYCAPRVWICELRFYNAPASLALPPAGALSNGTASLVRDNLGTRTLEGLELIGTRETQTVAAAVTGANRPLVVVKEFWYSSRLGINVLTDRTDPRSGQAIFTVSDIRLSEPASSLFALPVNFRIVDLRVAPTPPSLP